MSEYISSHQPEELHERYFGFPEGLTYDTFKDLPQRTREAIVKNNLILQTDTYNRTMEHARIEEWDTPATYVLQLRRSPHDYHIIEGIRRAVEAIAETRITQSMLDFAKEWYQNHAAVPFYNEKKWQDIIDAGGYLPIEIDALPDGTAALPGDPVIRVSGPNELVAHFEPDFHRAFYATGVATNSHYIEQHDLSHRFIDTSKRGLPVEEMHMIAAEAMFVGGGITMTSNDAAAVVHEHLRDTGTIGHRFIQAFKTEEAAFIHGIERLPNVTLLVDTIESYQGIDKVLALKVKYRESGKRIAPRIDSGDDIAQQAIYALKRMEELGLNDPDLDKVAIMSLTSLEQMPEIDEMVRAAGFDPDKRIVYGAGHIFAVKGTTRNDESSGFKITKYLDMNTMKFSSSVGKRSIPGVPTLVQMADGTRMRAQIDEIPRGQGQDLLVPVYRNGYVLASDDLLEARARVAPSFEQIRDEQAKSHSTPLSPQTLAQVEEIKKRLHVV